MLAGDGTILWSRMASVMGRRMLRLPPVAWHSLTSIAWDLGLQSDSPACGLNFIRYRWTASTEKLRRELRGESATHVHRGMGIVCCSDFDTLSAVSQGKYAHIRDNT